MPTASSSNFSRAFALTFLGFVPAGFAVPSPFLMAGFSSCLLCEADSGLKSDISPQTGLWQEYKPSNLKEHLMLALSRREQEIQKSGNGLQVAKPRLAQPSASLAVAADFSLSPESLLPKAAGPPKAMVAITLERADFHIFPPRTSACKRQTAKRHM